MASGSQVGGDRDIPVPHGITGYVPCALAGYNARCSFTVVIRQKIRPRTLASPASHCYWLVIGDIIPLLTSKTGRTKAGALKVMEIENKWLMQNTVGFRPVVLG